MDEFYTTIENQRQQDGAFALLYEHFHGFETQTASAKDRAYAKFFTICAAAAVSGIPYHSACIIRSDGTMIEGRVWDRRADPVTVPEQSGPEEQAGE